MQELNHSKLLGVLAGQGGDVFIGVEAVTDKKFSLIEIGPDGATVTVCKIRGVDVLTARGYGALPAGYQMVAGGDDYFDAITLTAGSAEGVLYPEEPVIGGLAVAVADGGGNAAMTAEITFNNTGNAGSKKVLVRVRDAADAIVQTWEKIVYFLKGSSLTVDVTGMTYFNTAAEGYELDIQIEGSDVWTSSAPFEVTTEA